ncbi:Uncharacterised protein [Rhodococcus wratislaviensis]|uniref:Secreted protein n=1 Tax=Rhodococcus wratislaviensis TaxID=44752 RepID=A0AB38F6X3_RHOWR|nr:Uncharacterised protein [Rhodococcus wratislaviensis]
MPLFAIQAAAAVPFASCQDAKRSKTHSSAYARAAVYKPGGDLRAGGETELGQHILDVSLRCAWRDHQAGGDCFVGQALGDQLGDL